MKNQTEWSDGWTIHAFLSKPPIGVEWRKGVIHAQSGT